MERNPFLDNRNNEDGSLLERLHIRHALFSKKGEIPDIDSSWEKLSRRIDEQEKQKSMQRPDTHAHVLKMTLRWCGVAALIVCIVGFVMFLVNGAREQQMPSVEIYIASAESSPEIILKSSSGESHSLTALKKVVTSERITSYEAAKDTMTVTTSAGQEIMIVLPDSSKVWLWANSSLEFPAKFADSERVVKLRGEAYFDVETDSLHPFVVETPYIDTRVYGTEFAINAISKAEASVVLVDGSLGVAPHGNLERNRIIPGQLARLAGAVGMDVAEVDVYPWIQRRDGMFYFEEERLFDVLLEIGRWYNISIISYNEAALGRHVHFVADRTENPRDVLKELDKILDVEVMFDGDQIVVN